MRAPSLQVEPLALTSGALLALAERFPQRYPVLLDSAAEGPLSQVTLLAALPQACLQLDASGVLRSTGLPEPRASGFLEELDRHWREAPRPAPVAPLPLPFHGGWFVYLGYELALEIEPTLGRFWPAASRLDRRPVAWAMRIPAVLGLDAAGQGFLITEDSVTPADRQRIRQDLEEVARLPMAAANPDLEAAEEDAQA